MSAASVSLLKRLSSRPAGWESKNAMGSRSTWGHVIGDLDLILPERCFGLLPCTMEMDVKPVLALGLMCGNSL